MLVVLVDFFEEVVVPGLAETTDKRAFEVLVEGDTTGVAAFYGTTADVPLMVVDGYEGAVNVDTDGIEVAGDGFRKIYFSVAVGFFYCAVGCSVLTPGDVGTFLVVDEWGAGLRSVVESRDTFSVYHFDAFGCHVGFYLGEDFF